MKPTQALYGLSAIKLAKCSPVSGTHSPRDKLFTRALLLLLLASTCGLTAGCTLLRVRLGKWGKPSAQPLVLEEQLELERFADDFFARTGQGLDKSAERLGTDAGREQALRIKLIIASSVLSIVSGPNPNVNLLDLVSVTVLTRLSIQDYWMHTTNGAAFQPWLDVTQVLETDVWDLAARYLSADEVAKLRKGIIAWYEQTPEVRVAFFGRPHSFADWVRTIQPEEAASTSISLVNLDPTAGLDPAVREVTQTRLLAERALYTAQRMPFLIRFQGEVLGYELAEQPTPRKIVSNSTQLSESFQRIGVAAANLSQTVAQLPDRISAEREKIVADIVSQEGKSHDLIADVDRALISGEKMSNSLNITLANFTRLMQLFGVGKPRANKRPFDILDYAKTVEEVGAATQNLNALIVSMNQSAPEIQRLSWEVSADLQKQVDRAFRLGLVLIAVLLTGAVLAGLVYRFLAEKLKQRAAAGGGSS